MILTRTYLNSRRSGARKLLGSPQAMHAALLAGFPPDSDPGRILWRVDHAKSVKPVVYIVSRDRPDLVHLDEQAGWPSLPSASSLAYDGFLDQLATGQTWGFRLTANPAHHATENGRKRVYAHVTAAQQATWLLDRSDRLGIRLTDPGDHATPTFQVIERSTRTFRRDSATVTLGVATYTGVLQVTDPQLLQQALTAGVGRAKAYGCGLMTLAGPA